MKINKIKATTFCIMMVCSLFLASITGIVIAQQGGYEVISYEGETEPIVDGTWTTSFEWSDAEERQLDGDLDATFRLKYVIQPQGDEIVYHNFLVEFFDDTTNDAGDYLQICLAAADELDGIPTGGTTPQTDSTRFDFVGHDVAGFTFYRGDGSAWVENSGYIWGIDVQIADSFGTSPLSDTPHLIVEVKIAPQVFDINPEFWIRVAAYDESNAGAGVQAWPTGSVDVPDDWGSVELLNETIPEFPSWIILPMFVMATLAIIIGRKRLTKSGTLT
ncbi:MAG: hypothetical protein MUO76_07890 [Anaerolineaceae bacterium]|nr:hypothetical protein [Anaerolineaceae bacterium]